MAKLCSNQISSSLVEATREASPDFDYDGVRAALSGNEDAGNLSAEERAVFLDSFGEALAAPTPAEEQFWAERRRRGGGVGLDERGQLVQALPGGGRKVTRKMPGRKAR